jgi:hypothetical protein
VTTGSFADIPGLVRERVRGAGSLAGRVSAHAFIYWDRIDSIGHVHGPSSLNFEHESVAALDALQAAVLTRPRTSPC